MALLFFFLRRRRHTRLQGDWSSDVCSSDLYDADQLRVCVGHAHPFDDPLHRAIGLAPAEILRYLFGKRPQIERRPDQLRRSEERRVGKESENLYAEYDG